MNALALPLLVELFTEELPPRALRALGDAFAACVADGLRTRGLALQHTQPEGFATPRRLAVRVPHVLTQAPDREVEAKGPSVKVGLDAQGQPTQALLKWAERQGARIDQLSRGSDGRQEVFFFRSTQPGEALAHAIGPVIEMALSKLPIPKLMQYQLADGRTTVSFVRPAHRLVALHGSDVLPCALLGLESGRTTEGHRFLGDRSILLDDPDSYEQALLERGRVVASFDERRRRIEAGLLAEARRLESRLTPESGVADEQALADTLDPYVDEVTALVEWPRVYVGRFEPEFLAVPQECLILTMRTNQKYFPLFDAQGRLTPRFLIVSNMEVDDPTDIVDGNERVVRPRLADARFFFEQDKKGTLAGRVPQLASVVYHAKLGNQAERVERVRAIARGIATQLGQDADAADRAAMLAKADLLTGMVGEFPELQGVMGRYYALHDGESPEVADAIAEHYRPRFAGDALPATQAGTAVALADKLETLAGIWGIGAQPTGDKDPFALRRHALGVVRMLIEKRLPLDLRGLLSRAFDALGGIPAVKPDVDGLHAFVVDRLRGWLRERGTSSFDADAALAVDSTRLDELLPRLDAVAAFRALPQAEALAAANKRIGNILRKSEAGLGPESPPLDPALLVEPAERALADALTTVAPRAEARLAARDYTGSLRELAALRTPVDAFFDSVMVMADDPRLRANRIALLRTLHAQMNRVADLSRLAA